MYVRSTGFIKRLRRGDQSLSKSTTNCGDLPFYSKKDLIILLVMEKEKSSHNEGDLLHEVESSNHGRDIRILSTLR